MLERLALHRPELRAWAMYDWAVSAMQTTIMAAVFPIYFVRVASAGIGPERGQERLALANATAMAVIVVLSPILGALADHSAMKKKLLTLFMAIGVTACAGMWFIGPGDATLAATLYAFAMLGAQGSMAFYGALLPHVARPDEIDRVSTAGYAIGYIGGGVLLAVNLLWIQMPGLFGLPSGEGLTPTQATLPTRLAFLSVAVWWVLFSIPLLRRVPEPPATLEPGEPRGNAFVAPFVRLGHTLRELRGFKQAFLLLLAFAIYNDGIQTIIKMATAYGTGIGIGQSSLIAAILVVQFVGIPFAFLFGALAGRIGAKRAVMGGLAVYVAITILAFNMRTATHFLLLALLVGTVQGGTQALSRSLFGSMTPRHRSGEFFGFFGVFEKFSGLLGPLVYAGALRFAGSSRAAILSIVIFFVAGMILLVFVNVGEGQRAARAADAETDAPPAAA